MYKTIATAAPRSRYWRGITGETQEARADRLGVTVGELPLIDELKPWLATKSRFSDKKIPCGGREAAEFYRKSQALNTTPYTLVLAHRLQKSDPQTYPTIETALITLTTIQDRVMRATQADFNKLFENFIAPEFVTQAVWATLGLANDQTTTVSIVQAAPQLEAKKDVLTQRLRDLFPHFQETLPDRVIGAVVDWGNRLTLVACEMCRNQNELLESRFAVYLATPKTPFLNSSRLVGRAEARKFPSVQGSKPKTIESYAITSADEFKRANKVPTHSELVANISEKYNEFKDLRESELGSKPSKKERADFLRRFCTKIGISRDKVAEILSPVGKGLYWKPSKEFPNIATAYMETQPFAEEIKSLAQNGVPGELDYLLNLVKGTPNLGVEASLLEKRQAFQKTLSSYLVPQEYFQKAEAELIPPLKATWRGLSYSPESRDLKAFSFNIALKELSKKKIVSEHYQDTARKCLDFFHFVGVPGLEKVLYLFQQLQSKGIRGNELEAATRRCSIDDPHLTRIYDHSYLENIATEITCSRHPAMRSFYMDLKSRQPSYSIQNAYTRFERYTPFELTGPQRIKAEQLYDRFSRQKTESQVVAILRLYEATPSLEPFFEDGVRRGERWSPQQALDRLAVYISLSLNGQYHILAEQLYDYDKKQGGVKTEADIVAEIKFFHKLIYEDVLGKPERIAIYRDQGIFPHQDKLVEFFVKEIPGVGSSNGWFQEPITLILQKVRQAKTLIDAEKQVRWDTWRHLGADQTDVEHLEASYQEKVQKVRYTYTAPPPVQNRFVTAAAKTDFQPRAGAPQFEGVFSEETATPLELNNQKYRETLKDLYKETATKGVKSAFQQVCSEYRERNLRVILSDPLKSSFPAVIKDEFRQRCSCVYAGSEATFNQLWTVYIEDREAKLAPLCSKLSKAQDRALRQFISSIPLATMDTKLKEWIKTFNNVSLQTFFTSQGSPRSIQEDFKQLKLQAYFPDKEVCTEADLSQLWKQYSQQRESKITNLCRTLDSDQTGSLIQYLTSFPLNSLDSYAQQWATPIRADILRSLGAQDYEVGALSGNQVFPSIDEASLRRVLNKYRVDQVREKELAREREVKAQELAREEEAKRAREEDATRLIAAQKKEQELIQKIDSAQRHNRMDYSIDDCRVWAEREIPVEYVVSIFWAPGSSDGPIPMEEVRVPGSWLTKRQLAGTAEFERKEFVEELSRRRLREHQESVQENYSHLKEWEKELSLLRENNPHLKNC